MIVILSPAKNLHRGCPVLGKNPPFLDQTVRLVEGMKQYQPWELEGLLKINPQLALKAYNDYLSFF